MDNRHHSGIFYLFYLFAFKASKKNSELTVSLKRNVFLLEFSASVSLCLKSFVLTLSFYKNSLVNIEKFQIGLYFND